MPLKEWREWLTDYEACLLGAYGAEWQQAANDARLVTDGSMNAWRSIRQNGGL